MATGWPMKTTYANGDVYSASDVNDTNGTINLLGSSVAYTAGKNKIINGDFGVWQRGTTFSPTSAANLYTSDRWSVYQNGSGTFTTSQQSFTPGTAPVAGYEGSFFIRNAITTLGTTNAFLLSQRIENVRTFAGQSVVVSFWAKSLTGLGTQVSVNQNFGSGGSGAVSTSGSSLGSVTTSWQRFTSTITIPSISGKTIGTSSYLELVFTSSLTANQSIDIWGVQLEEGSTATAFQTATGTIQGELAACQRYYYRAVAGQVYGTLAQGVAINTTQAHFFVPFPVTLRTTPASVEYANLILSDVAVANFAFTSAAIVLNQSSSSFGYFTTSGSSGLSGYRPMILIGNNNAAGYVGFSAEL